LAPPSPTRVIDWPRRDVCSVEMRIRIGMSFLVSAACLTGCGRHSAGPTTRVTILAVNPSVGRAEFHVSCGPAGGDVPSPKRACAALTAAPDLVTSPKPFRCFGVLYSWWELTVSGRVRGHGFRSHTATCWTPQMALIGRLGIAQSLDAHLLPRRRQGLFGGQQRSFPPGTLRPGDLVVCDTHGRHLEDGVPIDAEGGGSETGYDGVGVISVSLRVTRHRDGSVTASCT